MRGLEPEGWLTSNNLEKLDFPARMTENSFEVDYMIFCLLKIKSLWKVEYVYINVQMR